jgi:hypothetical protein
MRKALLFAVCACTLFACTAWAQGHSSQVGTWKLETAQSNFGSEPAPKSLTVTILKDTPQLLSWRVDGIDEKGKNFSYSWSGPQDGSLHPVVQNGKEISKQSAKRNEDGSLLRHDEDPDGTTMDALSKVSDDGKMITDEASIKAKDGKESKQKWVYRRVSGKKA